MMREYLKEEFKTLDVEDCEWRYEISNYGRVFDKINNKFVAQVVTGKPQYFYVNLMKKDKTRILRRVHNLMGKVFIPNPHDHRMVDHIDRNKMNNSLDNLRWVSRRQNSNNRDSNVLFFNIPLKQYCLENYPDDDSAYSYIYTKFTELGCEEETLRYYKRNREYGCTKEIRVQGKKMWLLDYLRELGISSEEYYRRKRSGLSDEGIYKGYVNTLQCDLSFGNSVEISLSNNSSVYYWFPSKISMIDDTGLTRDIWKTRENNGCKTLEEYNNYSNTPVYEVYGNTGTLRELSEIYNIRYETVTDRYYDKGWSLGDSLTTKKQKIKHYTVNGVRKTKKEVWEMFVSGSINKNLNSAHSKSKIPLDKYLEKYHNVDLSKYIIEPCI